MLAAREPIFALQDHEMYTDSLKRFSAFGWLILAIILTAVGVFAPSSMAMGAGDFDEETVRQWVRDLRSRAKAAGICENYVSSPAYAESRVFMGDDEPTRLSLKPEPGSIEDLYPGTIYRLIDARLRLLEFIKSLPPPETWNSETVMPALLDLALRTSQIADSVPDHRMQMIAADFVSYLKQRTDSFHIQEHHRDIEVQLTMVAASAWEMIIACLFNGEKFYLNRMASQLQQGEFTKMNVPSKEKDGFNREIDIAIQKEDGTWRWIEVKDWNVTRAGTPQRVEKVINQSWGQDKLRKKLNLDVEMILVMKYGYPGTTFLHVKLESKFDQILFAFPTGN